GTESVVLPIELVKFYGLNNNNGNIIYWTTASEENNDYFTLEHSTNGKNFNAIFTIKGAGNSTSIINYSYTHVDPPCCLNYYRLHQTDYDGKRTCSKQIVIETEKKNIIENVYINEQNKIIVDLSSETERNSSIQIINATGAILYTKQYELTTGNNRFFIDAPLSAGIYCLTVSFDDKTFTRKVIISK
ncbi:MAG TPA: T9SS type A sorting domain-containing protein, partial [Bacteroidia bacterium]|nr:T9SS type A sorting domain-containing protein [Bacteroidia bacterium]